MTMLLLAEPLDADTVILANTPPAETDRVVASLPEPSVTPLATDRLPRPLGSTLEKVTPALVASSPPV